MRGSLLFSFYVSSFWLLLLCGAGRAEMSAEESAARYGTDAIGECNCRTDVCRTGSSCSQLLGLSLWLPLVLFGARPDVISWPALITIFPPSRRKRAIRWKGCPQTNYFFSRIKLINGRISRFSFIFRSKVGNFSTLWRAWEICHFASCRAN